MALPTAIAGALEGVDTSSVPGTLATEAACQGAKFHSPTPLALFKVEIDGRTVILCGTCQTNLEVLRVLLRHYGKELAWPVRREFGNMLRALLIKKESDG